MIKNIVINIFRIVLATTFIFSGFVKAIDPIGTQYKLQDYLEAIGMFGYVPDFATLSASVLLAMMEFTMGMFLLFAIYRRLVTKLMVVFMTVMTLITVWIYLADPVSDCGCFGDAITLTNGQTLAKNIVLLIMSLTVAWRPLSMGRFVSLGNQWIVFHYTFVFSLGVSVWSLYDLPVFDFRPYHVGVNIPQAMAIPEGAELPQFDTTFILEKDGVRKEFTLDDYPDSTWTFIDSKTVQITEGFVPPIHDFSITAIDEKLSSIYGDVAEGDDITSQVLEHKGYTFMLIAPHLEKADDSTFGNIDIIYEYAKEHGYPFLCLTASGDSAISYWRDITGAEYDFAHTDETTLKTVIRSNPGLLLIKDGTIIGKWSHNSLPVDELLSDAEEAGSNADSMPLEKTKIGTLHEDGMMNRIIMILLWFVLPLTLLSIADRLWFWSRWIKNKEQKTLGINPVSDGKSAEDNKKQTTKQNEKENRSR